MNKFISFLLIVSLSMPVSFALDCSGGASVTKGTHFLSVLCPLLTALDVAIRLSGVVFGIFVVYSGIKLSMALGDPKGYTGAKQTLTYAIFGFCVVMGFFAIFTIVSNLFGISGFGSTEAIITQLDKTIAPITDLITK